MGKTYLNPNNTELHVQSGKHNFDFHSTGRRNRQQKDILLIPIINQLSDKLLIALPIFGPFTEWNWKNEIYLFLVFKKFECYIHLVLPQTNLSLRF